MMFNSVARKAVAVVSEPANLLVVSDPVFLVFGKVLTATL